MSHHVDRQRVLWHTALLAVALGGILSTSATLAFQKGDQFKLGDGVEVEQLGTWHPGKVTEIAGKGWYWVQLDKGGNPRLYTPKRIRPRGGGESTAETIGSTNSENPFATPDELKKDHLRNWKDASGRFEVMARLIRVEDDKVVLKREDGKELEVPLDRLSDADRAFVLPAADTSDTSTAESTEDDVVELTPTDLNRAHPVDTTPSDQWSYTPDAAPAVERGNRSVRITLGRKASHFDKPVDLLLLPQSEQAFAVLLDDPPGREASARIFACDLAKQKLTAVGQFPIAQIPVAMTQDGAWVVAREARFGMGNQSTLCLHALQDQEVKPKVAWQPYQHAHGPWRDVVWVSLVQDEALLTMSREGQLALWRIPELKPVWVATGLHDARPGLSAGGQAVALPVRDGVVLLEAMSGKKLGFLPTDLSFGQCLVGFDPSGTRLALGVQGRCRVWQLDTKELIRDFPVPHSIRGEKLDWLDHQTVAVDGRHTIDVERRIWLWDYQAMTPAARLQNGRLWYVAEGVTKDEFVLASATMPDEAPRQAVASIDADSLLVVKPGMTVTVSLTLGGQEGKRREIIEALTKRLEASGLQVADGGQITLVGSIRPGETHDIEYRTFGSFDTTKHRVTGQVLELAYEFDGQTVWKYTSETYPPHMVELQEGESLDQALRREMKQDPEHFGRVWLPGYVARDSDKPLGSSATPAG